MSRIDGGKVGDEFYLTKDRPLEMVICVGSPGSGKSTFVKQFLSDYERINNDTLKSKENCIKACRLNLNEGKSVVVDNTNPSKEVRAIYLKVAKELKVKARCIFFDTPKETCVHNNKQRALNTHRDHISKKVPIIALHVFFKNIVTPKASEGFERVIKVNFIPDLFQNKKDK